MAATTAQETPSDNMATSIAAAVTIANKQVREAGYDITNDFVSVTQKDFDNRSVWQVDYIPRNYLSQRGGGFSVKVDASDLTVLSALRGQ